MKDGAWINAANGRYCWITEHASWIQIQANATQLGVPEEVQARLRGIKWDFNGEGRKAILMEAMGAGFIRVRGHGSTTTFESRIALEDAILAAAPFMAENFGPLTGCRFNHLDTNESWGAPYGTIASALAKDDLSHLLVEP